jgi:hypothetical protein
MTMQSEKSIIEKIGNNALRELVRQFRLEPDEVRKKEFKATILRIVENRERDSFLTRFVLRDYESWHKVLTEEESVSTQAHRADFFEPNLIAVLREKGGQLEPLKAIQLILERVKEDLSLADFALTASKLFRYDRVIRFLADNLKKRGILSKAEEHKNRVWALTEQGKKSNGTLSQQKLEFRED